MSTQPRTLQAGLLLVLCAALGCGGGDTSSSAPASTAPTSSPSTQAPPATNSGPAAPMGTASIRGTITFSGNVPRLRPLKMDADPGCAKKHSGPVAPEVLVLGEGNRLANIFVEVKSGLPGGSYPTPTEPAVLDQEGCRYIPHVMALQVNQPFKILNSDGLLHNIHSLPKVNSSFNRAMPATVTSADFVFDKVEPMFKIKCDVHPWMNAWVAVVPHPYFAVTGTDGAYEISQLPAGTYELEAWHERMGTRSFSVSVGDGEVGTHDLTFEM